MTAPPSDPGAWDPLAQRVAATPDRTALVDAATGESWTYRALDAAVDERARQLAGLGLGPGDHVGMLASTAIEPVRFVHAVWRLGGRLVPLNARLAGPELADRAARADLDLLAYTAETAESAGAVAETPAVVIDGGTESGAGGAHRLADVEPAVSEPAAWRPGDPALVPFTSGTTGEPKPVELTMGNLRASATASAFRLGVLPSDRWLLCLPVYHVGGLSSVVRCAHYGTALVVLEGFEPGSVARATREHDVTAVSLVPTQLRRMLDAGESFAGAVRTVLLGGAPAPPELVERCRRRDVPVHPTYGLTEAASQVATASPAQAFERAGTVGQPLQSVVVTIVGPDGDPLPAGERGEIVVSGPTVSPGYYGDPGATEAVRGPHGLHTGDRGWRDEDGFLRVVGRLDDRIVSGGETVQPGEVAAALRAHPDVADAAVVGLPDPEWGERVAALVVPAAGTDPGEAALAAFCRERLAGYKVPGTLSFADSLPRTPSGTVDREALRDRLAG